MIVASSLFHGANDEALSWGQSASCQELCMRSRSERIYLCFDRLARAAGG